MTVVVNTPNGHVGRVVTDLLIEAGEHVTILTRDASRVSGFAERGATVYQGDLEDLSFVKDATRGCAVLVWATPQNYAHRDLVWFQNQLGKNVARAIDANSISHVINISSIGAHRPLGTGAIKGLREVERMLERTEANVLNLRASYFMENYCLSLRSIRAEGAVYLPVDGEVEVTMIAAQDIGRYVAELVAACDWRGHTVREFVGPHAQTFIAAAETLSDVLERPIRHVSVSPERFRYGLVRMGWSRSSVDLVSEMYGALAEGKLAPQDVPRLATTTLREFARQKLVEEMAARA